MTRKIAIITCYQNPDYVRAIVLRDAANRLENTQVTIIKNQYKGLLRYPEVIIKVIRARLTQDIDTYMITFRGYEILPVMRLLCWKKRVIFDEFINPIEWMYENGKLKSDTLLSKGIKGVYRQFVSGVDAILTDTDVHAEYSSRLMGISRDKYVVLPVGTDETLFKPPRSPVPTSKEVFYYGSSMLPLHGLDVVCDAAVIVARDNPEIRFVLVGKGKDTQNTIGRARAKGANIGYKAWVPFDKLPDYVHKSALCLGGPFGDTLQANMVITGKTYQFLACAAPTVIGKIDSNTLFLDRQNCLLVRQGDPDALAATIKWGVNHPGDLRKVGTAGRLLFEEQFSVDVISKHMQAMLKNL